MLMLLTDNWVISADTLPDSLPLRAQRCPALPGAQMLDDLSDLLGEEEPQPISALCAPTQADTENAIRLPLRFPQELTGEVALSLEIPFGHYSGDFAELVCEHILGSGEVFAGEERVSSFSPALSAPLRVDLSDALRIGRRQTLSLRFGADRPAGILSAPVLRILRCARMSDFSIRSERDGAFVSCSVQAAHEGSYLLTAQSASAQTTQSVRCTMRKGEKKTLSLQLPCAGAPFTPGVPLSPDTLLLELRRTDPRSKRTTLCDRLSFLFAYSVRPPLTAVPLPPGAADTAADELLALLRPIGAEAVFSPAPLPLPLCRALLCAGFALALDTDSPAARLLPVCRDFPRETQDETPALNAWKLCAAAPYDRKCAEPLRDAQALLEISGRKLDPLDSHVQDVLSWLRVVRVRLRAEAMRQGYCRGLLCASHELTHPEITSALHTALAPAHVSVLPLMGAWWASSRFSASVCVFAPESSIGALTLCVTLQDEQDHTLAALDAQLPPRGGRAGILETQLPDCACVLTLRAQLFCDGNTLEDDELPVYVGATAPLEAAF